MLSTQGGAFTEIVEGRATEGYHQHASNFGRALLMLPSGSYTVRVEARTNCTFATNPSTNDFTQRSLLIHLFGS